MSYQNLRDSKVKNLETKYERAQFLIGGGIFLLHFVSTLVEYRKENEGPVNFYFWLGIVITLLIKQLITKSIIKFLFKKCLSQSTKQKIYQNLYTIKSVFACIGLVFILIRIIYVIFALNIQSSLEFKLWFNVLLLGLYIAKLILFKNIVQIQKQRGRQESYPQQPKSKYYQLQ